MAEMEKMVLEQVGLRKPRLDALASIIWPPRETLAHE